MPPSPPPLARPIPLVFLERLSRPILVRLLAPHSPALLAHSFPLATLAAAAQTERTEVTALWRLLSSPPPDLAPLHDSLLTLADLATHSAHEILLSRDTARVLDHELGAEDCTAIAFLDYRALFDSLRPHAGQSQTKAFASFEPTSPRPLPGDPAHAAAFARSMSEALLARGRSDYFRTHEWQSGNERHLELRYGRLAATNDLLGKTESGAGHDVTAQVTYRTPERAHAVFHDDTMRLDVAGPDWVKELVRRIFGEAFFGSGEHFKEGGTITLAPLRNLEAALSTHGVPGLSHVELQKIWIDLGDGSGGIGVWGKSSCRNGLAGDYVLRALSDGGACEATFHLFLVGKTRPLTLTIVAPTKLVFERGNPRVARIVREWVVAAGYMRLPEHLRASEVPEAVESVTPPPQSVPFAEEQRASE